MNKKDDYIKNIHRAGRIGTVIAIAIMLGIPFAMGIIYDSMPPLQLVLQVGGQVLIMFVPVSISEIISYAPILGSSAYITFITGNVTNLKIPVALNSLKISGTEQSTEKGDAIIMVGVAASSIVTMVIITIGLLLMVPLRPILELPEVAAASNYMMPALLGALVLGLFNNKSGKYVMKNRLLAIIPSVIIMAILNFTGLWNAKYQGIFIVLMIPVTILTARILYKQNIIQITEDK